MDKEIMETQSETTLARAAEAGELLSLQGQIDPAQLEKIANQRVEFYRKIALISLKLTSVHDWVDAEGKPYLQASGAKKLMKLWGVKIDQTRMEMEMDEATGVPIYKFWGRAGSKVLGVELDVFGGRNGNDPFYSKQGHLDLLDVQKAAYNNFLARGIKAVIGLDNMTWEEIAEMTQGRITKDKATGKVTYQKKPTNAPQQAPDAPTASVEPQAQGNTQPEGFTPPPMPQHYGAIISESQGKRFFAIAKGAGWQDEEIKAYLRNNYGIEHSRDIKKGDYEKICQDMQAGGSH